MMQKNVSNLGEEQPAAKQDGIHSNPSQLAVATELRKAEEERTKQEQEKTKQAVERTKQEMEKTKREVESTRQMEIHKQLEIVKNQQETHRSIAQESKHTFHQDDLTLAPDGTTHIKNKVITSGTNAGVQVCLYLFKSEN